MDSQHSATSERPVFGRSSDGPLSGILIADFGRVLAGPYCTMLLADLGATVIKIESPAGDETRAWKPPTRGNDSTYFLSINRNKTSIKLDLRDPEDRRTAQRIAERADVVVENFKPGDLCATAWITTPSRLPIRTLSTPRSRASGPPAVPSSPATTC